VIEFGPLALQAIPGRLAASGITRRYVNHLIDAIRRVAVRADEAARLLRFSERMIYELTRAGKRPVIKVGRATLYLTTAHDHVMIGHHVAISMTTSDYCTLVGPEAGFHLVTGHDDAFIGYKAGYNAIANENTFVGGKAGPGITSDRLVP
jgi:hypothetical protein